MEWGHSERPFELCHGYDSPPHTVLSPTILLRIVMVGNFQLQRGGGGLVCVEKRPSNSIRREDMVAVGFMNHFIIWTLRLLSPFNDL